MHWRPGICPEPRWRSLQRSPDFGAGLRGGKEKEKEGREKGGKGKGEEEEGRRRKWREGDRRDGKEVG